MIAFFLLLILLVAIFCYRLQRKRYYLGPPSDHFDGRYFFNPRPNSFTFFDVLRWKSNAAPKPWPEHVKSVVPFIKPDARLRPGELKVTFIGHSTVLIQIGELNILTDPVWSERASPFTWMGPKRVEAPGIPLDALPPIDIVLLSHNHYDHMDLKTVQALWRSHHPLIVAPLGNDAIVHAFDSSIAVVTLDWETSHAVSENVSLHLQPVQHWSSRHFWDRNKALWGSFVIQTPSGKVYFAGDTGYNEGIHFKKTQEAFGPFRLALLPIGAIEPRWFMEYGHMNPEEAVLAHKDLGGPLTLAIHFGTFHLSDESYEDPLKDLEAARQKYHVTEERFRALKAGVSWQVPES